MTSQDALISYFVETSGITSPTLVAERLGVPVETARKWMRRYRTMQASEGTAYVPVKLSRCRPNDRVQRGLDQ